MDEHVASLARAGLTRERAVEIALMNNRGQQARLAGLGIAQAELVAASRLNNPRLSASIGLPVNDKGETESEIALSFDVLQLVLQPMRERAASGQLAASIAQAADDALRLVADVSAAFARVQAVMRHVELLELDVAAAAAAAELARRQFEAGNIRELDLTTRQAEHQQSRIELARRQLDVTEAREHLNRLLGLTGDATTWTLVEPLPEPPREEAPLDHLEALAIEQRLDVEAARMQVDALGAAVGVAQNSSLFGAIEIGIHTHQDPNGPALIGPTLEVELPVLNQGQGLVGRARSQHRQAQLQLEALAIDVRSHVRVARTALLAARLVVEHYRDTLLPLREKAVEQAQLQNNAMQLGLYELLDTKRAHLRASREYVDALREYWVARAELERAVGGRLAREETHDHSGR